LLPVTASQDLIDVSNPANQNIDVSQLVIHLSKDEQNDNNNKNNNDNSNSNDGNRIDASDQWNTNDSIVSDWSADLSRHLELR
jgi:hypothetical protein